MYVTLVNIKTKMDFIEKGPDTWPGRPNVSAKHVLWNHLNDQTTLSSFHF